MSARTRIALYGTCAALVLLALLGVLAVPGRTGEVIAISGGSLGGIGLISMMFAEVGLSEDRERVRAGERERRGEREQPAGEPGPPAAEQEAEPGSPDPPRRLARPTRRRR